MIENLIKSAQSNPIDFGLHAMVAIGGIMLLAQGVYDIHKKTKEYMKKNEERMENECITEYTLDRKTGDTLSIKRYIPETSKL